MSLIAYPPFVPAAVYPIALQSSSHFPATYRRVALQALALPCSLVLIANQNPAFVISTRARKLRNMISVENGED
jgi:hypothetical protein